MDLNANATEDHIFQWAAQYLTRPSAEAFTEWINQKISDWENDAFSIRDVLTGAYQQWTGGDLPAPDCAHGYRLTDTCPACDTDQENA